MIPALQRPVGILPLVIFRIGFGLVLFVSTVRFMANGWVEAFYIQPSFHFTYWGFDWLRPLPGVGMWVLYVGMALLAFMLALGALYRLSAVLFFAFFTYVELLDKAYYLNHYYLVSLLSFLMIFLPAHAKWSVDGWLRPSIRRDTVPLWMLSVLRLQLALVYFFAGFAKVDGDWLLRALPLRMWLRARASIPLIGSLLDYPWTAYALSWGGMLYDLTIPLWLVWRRTRWLAYVAVVVFHVMTAVLFPVIGMFPYIMLVSTLVFFSEDDYRALVGRVLYWLKRYSPNSEPPHPQPFSPVHGGEGSKISPQTPYLGREQESSYSTSDAPPADSAYPVGTPYMPSVRFRPLFIALSIYFALQLVLPLRHYLYVGNVNWTGEGFDFAWRVMLVEKSGYATFTVRDAATETSWMVYPDDYLTPQQERQMAFQPDLILQFAHYLRDSYTAMGYTAVEVYAEAYVSYNGRPGQFIIDPMVDLAQEVRSPLAKSWILPLHQ